MAVVVEIPLAYGREAEMQLRNGKKPSLEVAPTTLAQRTRQTTRNRSRPDVSKMNIFTLYPQNSMHLFYRTAGNCIIRSALLLGHIA